MGSLFYLASPYTKYHEGVDAAFSAVCKQAAFLKNNGIDVFSPIAHSHPISVHGQLGSYSPGDSEYQNLLEWDKKFIDRCDGIIVCMMDGWQESYGVKWEMEQFSKQGKPIFYMTPNTVPFHLTEAA